MTIVWVDALALGPASWVRLADGTVIIVKPAKPLILAFSDGFLKRPVRKKPSKFLS